MERRRKNAQVQGFLKSEMLTDAFKSVGIELEPRPRENQTKFTPKLENTLYFKFVLLFCR